MGYNWLLEMAWSLRELGLILAQDQRQLEFFHLRPEQCWAGEKKNVTRVITFRCLASTLLPAPA